MTVESFGAWKKKFEQELETAKLKAYQEHIKSLPPKEREEIKKVAAKASGPSRFSCVVFCDTDFVN